MADILITGGTGFIGSRLAKRYMERGDKVHILTRTNSSTKRLAEMGGSSIVTHQVDLSDRKNISTCVEKINPQRVFHLASMTRPPTGFSTTQLALIFEQDVSNLLILISALANLETPPVAFIRAGSLAEYGATHIPYRETDRELPVTAYGAAMASGTNHLNALKAHLPFPVISARLALIYGPLQSTQFLIPLMIEKFLAGDMITIKNPNERRDLLYINDVVDGLECISNAMPLNTDVINLCTGVAPTMSEVANLIMDATHASPSLLQVGEAKVAGGAAHLVGSPDRAEKLLKWRAKTSIEEGIQKTVSIMKNHTRILKAAQ